MENQASSESEKEPEEGNEEKRVCPYFLKGTCRQLTSCKWYENSQDYSWKNKSEQSLPFHDFIYN